MNKRNWTPDDIPKNLLMYDLVKEWADCGRPSEAIWGVINFLTHFKRDVYEQHLDIPDEEDKALCKIAAKRTKDAKFVSHKEAFGEDIRKLSEE